MKNSNIILMLSFLLSWPILALAAGSECTTSDSGGSDRSMAMKIKFIALASILAAGGLGVLIPILGRRVSALQPEKDVFFVVKAFAAGVILATGMIHILPVAFKNLTSPCLGREFLRKFPLAAFVAMVASLATLMIDAYATSYYRRSHFSKARPVDDGAGDEEAAGEHADHVHVHTHATHGHSHGAAAASPGEDDRLSETIRRRVVSQVLELGILVHSVIIGISLGASIHPSTIKPLMGALSFHQFFEGMGLGGCIVQAKFRTRSMAVMAAFFSLTAPMGIAAGMAMSSRYHQNSTTALVVEGVFNSASAGILIYMSLVDLLGADFMNPRMQNNGRLQLAAFAALLLGAGSMSLLAMWV